MIRNLVLSALLSLSVNAFAHQTKALTNMTNPTAQAFLDESLKLNKEDSRFTAVAAAKIVKISPVNQAETQAQTGERILKAVLHRDLPITGDDGGYSFDVYDKSSARKIAADLEHYDGFGSAESMASKLEDAANQGLLVYIGTGSGNNTAAYIAAVLDTKNNELVYFVSSNFGSDE